MGIRFKWGKLSNFIGKKVIEGSGEWEAGRFY
jgi:hypothetical protein